MGGRVESGTLGARWYRRADMRRTRKISGDCCFYERRVSDMANGAVCGRIGIVMMPEADGGGGKQDGESQKGYDPSTSKKF